jgi:RNA polymerase sigma factor (sigma-70 family)
MDASGEAVESMASSLASGTTLRHLRDLFHSGTAVGLTDGQLLARYAASHDGQAFAALVARHGPMVLATCRAILRQEHDVEDAFQATFLVLARKAPSVRGGDALGGWLHRVAYRVAIEASVAAQRRRRRETEAAAMAISDAARPGLDPDISSIVHEEVDRLPEGLRLAVVLCDLEGLTYEQAAGRLHWTEPTLRHRLVKARQRLRERLSRRGVTGAALGVVIAASEATAAVPAAWAEAAVAAATGGASSLAAGALAHVIFRSMFVARLKIVTAIAVVMIGIASAGFVAIEAGRPAEPRPAMSTPVVAQQPQGTAKDKDTASGTMIEVRGRVVGPDGKPVPGATLQTAYLDAEDHPAASGPDGRFLLMIPRSGIMLNGYVDFPWVVATAPGFGPGWVRSAVKAAAAGELAVRLAKDGPPIDGRLVDLEGRPVAGADIKVQSLYFAEEGDLTPWLARVKGQGARRVGDGLHDLRLNLATTRTGPDGRFQLTGLGRERIVHLLISGPTIATTEIYAMNRDGSDVRLNSQVMGKPAQQVIHTRRFTGSVAPTKPVEGIVRDKDNGRPIAGLTLRAGVYEARRLSTDPGIEATTDAQGHYRLTGLPKAPAYRLVVEQAEGKPYHKISFRVPADSPAFEPVTFDVALQRGILIRGRVTDKATGQPVSGYIHAFYFRDNPAIKDYPGYDAPNSLAYVPIKDDGRYEAVGLPGRNIIACRSTDLRRYRGTVGTETIPGYNRQYRTFDTLPMNCHDDNYHLLTEIDVDPKAESATLDLQLDPGRSLTVNAVDPEGKPVGGTKVKGITDLFSNALEYEQESPTIEIHALDPSKPRRVIVTHAGRKLIGTAYLKGDEAGPMNIQLQPWGTITGRVVADDGQPLKGLDIHSLGGIFPKRPDVQGILPDDVRVGSDGRFRAERLVPGLKYGASASDRMRLNGELFRDVTVAPGEVKDLGDRKIIPRGR